MGTYFVPTGGGDTDVRLLTSQKKGEPGAHGLKGFNFQQESKTKEVAVGQWLSR